MSLQSEDEDVVWDILKHYAEVQADVISHSVPSTNVEFIRQNLPFVKPLWLLPVTIFKIYHHQTFKSLKVDFSFACKYGNQYSGVFAEVSTQTLGI